MAGILSAIKLTEAGLSDFTVYEKADRLGGTWRENVYPGVSCDVPSHLYSYSFELNPEWSHVFSPGSEIQAYFEAVADRHGVRDSVRFGDEVVSCAWTGSRWTIETQAGHRDEVDVVIAATGVLHRPRIPELPGIESFTGRSFHSAQWDRDAVLDGARVGIVGTGSSAVQMVGALTGKVSKLVLFQRTAQWVLPQENPPYTEEDKQSFRESPEKMTELHQQISDFFASGFSNAVVDAESPQMKLIEEMCRKNLDDNVKDPVLRELLRPDYRAGCKRLIISPNFYEAIQSPNAQLVTDPIERVEPSGVVTKDGRLHELDVLVVATGFRVDSFMRPMIVTGRDELSLDKAWADRPQAYLSISIPDFPNFFMLNGPNGPVGNFSLIEVAELQFSYIQQLVETIRRGECREVSATHSALDAFEQDRVQAAKRTIWATGCHSWYLDDRGVPQAWPWSFDKFREAMAAPDMSSFECRT